MRIVFAMPADVGERLATDAGRYGHEVVAIANGAAALEAVVAEFAPEVVVAAATSAFLTEAVLARCDERGVRILAAIAGEADRRHAAVLGLYELTDASADWTAFERLVGGTRDRVVESSPVHGTVVTVWGPAGAPGRTSTAIGIAAELAAAGFSVALGDVDTHGASIAPTLGMLDEAPGFAAACRLAGAGGLDQVELERIGQRYGAAGSAFWVLTGIGRASRWPELSAERVRGAIEQCREWVDFTVLDTASNIESDEELSSDLFAPRRNGATIAALREADVVVAVGAADPVGLSRFLRAHVDLLDLVDPDRVAVVMNKVRASAIGLNPAGQVTQTLARFGGVQPAALIPFDQPGYDAAMLGGRVLAEVAPRSPARAAIAQFVRATLIGTRVAAVPAAAVRRRRWANG
jgi:Mrp family chromosome partitioning ATPase